ncbi:MAG: hypothetical protein SOZ34_03405 [Clostridia bacterium]|nr:hypothetical protein [Clostridia bacterium]
MSILMLCGSPHDEGGNSTYFLNALKEKLNGKGEIYNTSKFPCESEAAFLKAVEKGDKIVLSFPLYADSLPAYFLAFLKKVKTLTEGIKTKSRVYVIVNNGFYDDVQNNIAIKIIWKWCDKCGLKKGRALAVGAGGMVHAAPLGKGPLAKVNTALEQMAEDIENGRSGDTIFVKPSFPRFLYIFMGNLSFVAEGKKNGLSKADIKNLQR